MSQTNKPVVIFDLGGVLLRWNAREVIDSAPLSSDHRAAVAKHLLPSQDWTDFDRGTLDLPELIDRSVDRSGLHRSLFEKFFDHVGDFMTPKLDTVALLEELHAQDVPLYCLSNMPKHFIDRLESTHDFFNRFLGVYASARLGVIKPDPKIYQHVTRDANLNPGNCWFVDDLEVNIAAARDHGWNGICFESAAQSRQELTAAGVLPG